MKKILITTALAVLSTPIAHAQTTTSNFHYSHKLDNSTIQSFVHSTETENQARTFEYSVPAGTCMDKN